MPMQAYHGSGRVHNRRKQGIAVDSVTTPFSGAPNSVPVRIHNRRFCPLVSQVVCSCAGRPVATPVPSSGFCHYHIEH
eukprot:6468913-Amphidinium_carterae.3